MPILSVYFGNSSISFLYAESPKSYKFYKYPYTYSKSLFGHFVTENSFYTELFTMISKDLGIEKELASKSMRMIFTGFPHVPLSDFSPAASFTLDRVLAHNSQYFAIFVNDDTIINPATFFSSVPLKSYYKGELKSEVEVNAANYYSNLSIFPMAFHTTDTDRLERDNFIRFLSINSLCNVPKDQAIMLCGDRFSDASKYEPLTYLLALDLIKDTGIFQLKMDLDNIFPVLGLASVYDNKFTALFTEQKFWSIGTLINSAGATECVIEQQSGPTQFIDVKQNELFFLPLDEGTTIKVRVKSALLGNIERFVNGGVLGLIIDTRPKNNATVFTEKYVSKGYKDWQGTIKQILSTIK